MKAEKAKSAVVGAAIAARYYVVLLFDQTVSISEIYTPQYFSIALYAEIYMNLALPVVMCGTQPWRPSLQPAASL